jgi:hypothetical protein
MDVDYYARQIIVPGIGAKGQRRLLDACCVIAGNAVGVASAAEYLRAAGVSVHRTVTDTPRVTCLILADAPGIDLAETARWKALHCPVVWYRITAYGVTGGIADGIDQITPPQIEAGPSPEWPAALLEAAHQLAGCDAAATAVGVTLEWTVSRAPFRLFLRA